MSCTPGRASKIVCPEPPVVTHILAKNEKTRACNTSVFAIRYKSLQGRTEQRVKKIARFRHVDAYRIRS